MSLLFFDTETTGLVDFKSSYRAPHQPRLVQLAAVLHDDNRQVLDAVCMVVRPVGWAIPPVVERLHGISTEIAMTKGVPLALVLKRFSDMVAAADQVVAHNMQFDELVIQSENYRMQTDHPLAGKSLFCTMVAAADIMKIPGKRGGYKRISLMDAHQYFLGQPFDGAHDAMSDAHACARIYYQIQESLGVAV